jgi:two-component system OmpR family sensor kinase
VHDGHPTLIVRDDGPGIPADLQERVFERFVRGGGDAGHGARGTGLGLAIVDAVAASHGASVKLESLPSVRGTQFTVTFPPVPADVDQTHEGPAEAPLDDEALVQTSTTTGRTIGRRRSRS